MRRWQAAFGRLLRFWREAMSAAKELKAVARPRVGKGAARAVRREGGVPAVIYGGGAEVTPIALDGNEIRLLIFGGHFMTTVFELEVGGSKTRVIPREYQLDPVRDVPIHVDFLRLAEGQTLTLEIPVHFVNQEASPGLTAGGVLNIVRHTIELVVPSGDIPDSVDADLTGLEVGDSLHISAVRLPEGAKPTIDRDFTIATIAAPSALGADAEAEQAAVSGASVASSDAAKAEADAAD
jgi:large subunit ribosomal protein L25